MMKLLCFAMFACGFNLLLGYAGMLSFGHAAYFGFAAYITGWLATALGWPTVVSIVVGVIASALLGLVIGALAIRRSGIYFAMITLALGQLVYFICLQAPFTGGENGIQGVPRGSLFGLASLQSDTTMYYFVLATFVAVFLFIQRIVHSPFGQVLKAIRENEPRAISLGYDVNRFKLLAFVLSSAIAGLAGSLKCLTLGLATLSDVLQWTSGEVVLMTLLGGTGTFLGPVVGAGIVVTLQEYLSDIVGAWVTVIIGAIFVACVLAFRKGLVGEIEAWQQRRVARRSGATVTPEAGREAGAA
jgi:branched-chain amino acid transport system permease protein